MRPQTGCLVVVVAAAATVVVLCLLFALAVNLIRWLT